MSITSTTQADYHIVPKPKSKPVIALAGVPNCGKTTYFNALTGMNYKVANYPGVTVEKREGNCELPDFGEATIIDLPGAYSLLGGSPDELLAAQFLAGMLNGQPRPDLVICVADACNLERNLYLASQLLDLGSPVIIALSMCDLAERQNIRIHKELLSRTLGVPVLDIPGREKSNVQLLKAEIVQSLKNSSVFAKRYAWCPEPLFREKTTELGEVYLESAKYNGNTAADRILLGTSLLTGILRTSDAKLKEHIRQTRTALEDKGVDPGSFEAEKRYAWIHSIVQNCVVYADAKQKDLTDRVDQIVTHKVWGALIFLSIMTLIFQSIFSWATVPMEFIDSLFASFQNSIKTILPEGQLRSLIADGIIAGVGSVLIFIPQIAILYFFISLLEESGYLTRAAFLMDGLMRKCGLQGRSFIPLLSSFACAVPGIMSTRSIPSWTDRMATILVAPLMSCSARLPVYTLLIAACIPNTAVAGIFSLQGLVLLAMYLLGIFGAAAVAIVFRRTLFRKSPTHFVMEMPPYRWPRLSLVLRNIWDRICLFTKTAGTVILACAIVLWFLASYPRTETASPAQRMEASYAGQLGKQMEPILQPLGFDWKIGVSVIASFAAREVFVSSMALVHNLEDENSSNSLVERIQKATNPDTGKPRYTALTAISLMVFYVFSCQCMSTLAVCKRETGSWRWTMVMFLYMTCLAYLASLLTYQIGIRVL